MDKSPEEWENMNYVCLFYSPHWSCLCTFLLCDTAVNKFEM